MTKSKKLKTELSSSTAIEINPENITDLNSRYDVLMAISDKDLTDEERVEIEDENQRRDEIYGETRGSLLSYVDAKQGLDNRALEVLIMLQKVGAFWKYTDQMISPETGECRTVTNANVRTFILAPLFIRLFGIEQPTKENTLLAQTKAYLAGLLDGENARVTNPDSSAQYLIRLSVEAVKICIWADENDAWRTADNDETELMEVNENKINIRAHADPAEKEGNVPVKQISYSELDKIVTKEYSKSNGSDGGENKTEIEKAVKVIMDALDDCAKKGLPDNSGSAAALMKLLPHLQTGVLKAYGAKKVKGTDYAAQTERWKRLDAQTLTDMGYPEDFNILTFEAVA